MGFDNLPNGRLGETDFASNAGLFKPGVLVRLEDTLSLPLLQDPDGTWRYFGTTAHFEQVIVEQIGHALGLSDSTDPSAVMYPVSGVGNQTISASDSAGIHALYGLPGGPPAVTAPSSAYALNMPHTEYAINATQDGVAQIRDLGVPNAAPTTLPGVTAFQFTDGMELFDPTGNAARVDRLYYTVLGRARYFGGVQGFTAQLDAGQTTLSQVAATMLASPEYASRYGSPDVPTFIAEVYQNGLGRAADPAGVQANTAALAGGVSRAGVAIAESEEAKARFASSAGDATDAESFRLFEAALGRAPDLASQQVFASLPNQATSAAAVAQLFLSSPEYAQHYGSPDNATFISESYQTALGRPVDAAGIASVAAALQSGASRAQIIANLADSTEARAYTAAATHASWVYVG